MNREIFRTSVQALFTACGSKLSPQVLETWWKYLQHVDGQELAAACDIFAIRGDGYPTVAKIVALCPSVAQNKPSPESQAVLAWQDVTRAIRAVGAYGRPVFEDDRTHATVALMGWRKICDRSAADLVWLQKEFCQIYSVVQIGQKQPLAGLALDASPVVKVKAEQAHGEFRSRVGQGEHGREYLEGAQGSIETVSDIESQDR